MKTRIPIFLIAALCSQILSPQLSAQNMVFVSRNGENTAYCGPLGGPSAVHRFSLSEPTHDVISFSHPGATNLPQSSAASRLDVTAASSIITISAAGSAQRGPLRPFIDFGVYAVAGARDNWEFTLAEPARFTFNAAFRATSIVTSGPIGGFSFTGFGLRADPGTPPEALAGPLPATGSIVKMAKGRLLAGRYGISFNCLVDGNNTYPYGGSFDLAMSLELGPDVPAIFGTQFLPEGLEMKWSDLGPKQYTVEISSSFSGDNWMPVPGVTWPITNQTIVLPPPTVLPAFYRVKME